jgi:hypothetical protein
MQQTVAVSLSLTINSNCLSFFDAELIGLSLPGSFGSFNAVSQRFNRSPTPKGLKPHPKSDRYERDTPPHVFLLLSHTVARPHVIQLLI